MMSFDSQVATFTGVESFVDVTWTNAFTGSYKIVMGTETALLVSVALTNKVGASVRVVPSALFTGKVYLLAFEVP